MPPIPPFSARRRNTYIQSAKNSSIGTIQDNSLAMTLFSMMPV